MPDHDLPDRQKRRTLRRLGGAAAGATLLAAPAAARHRNDPSDGFFDEAEESPGPLDALTYVQGAAAGFRQRVFDERSAAQTAADATVEEFNAHSAAWVEYVNARGGGGPGHQVLAIEFVPDPESGETATRYLVADWSSSQDGYESAEMVAETDRAVDHRVRLKSIAADNAADELAEFRTEYIEPGETPGIGYAAEKAGKYRKGETYVLSTLFGDDL